ncbi:exodeoxyribonuclease VII large subunit [Betaproteobacteria bacterium SCN2]|jgi:exodeoxyribonuclease VII large subunit|nr:exodeoxyribonuclease VII large subunit [Betaproteobacteria bacterium SCN2]
MERQILPPSSPVLSVSALNSLARSAVENALPLVWVGGEISNLTRAASGHWYFSLKDDRAQVRCAMFRGRNQFVDWQPANGDQVEVRAVPTVYEARGEFQLQVELMRRAGLGALFEAFERLKQKLANEGLFEAARKRPLPLFPRRLGIVTSSEAAALRDVLTTLRRRAPWLPVTLYPTPVQGEGAGRKIAAAIQAAGQRGDCDVLIVCRGGGSIEDLWAFNDEAVARAIAACPVPVVSGVGHETDFTIADFVADLRAPTPTAAAEQVSASREEWMQRLTALQHRMARPLHRQLANRAQQVDLAARRLLHPAQRLAAQRDKLMHLGKRLGLAHAQSFARNRWQFDALARRLAAARLQPQTMHAELKPLQSSLTRALHQQLQSRRTEVERMAAHLAHLNPEAVLARGYSMVRNAQGDVVRSSAQIRLDETLDLRFHHGNAKALVTKKEE